MLLPSVAAGQEQSLRVQLSWQGDVGSVHSVHWSSHSPSVAGAVHPGPQMRIAEHPSPEGAWTGQPVSTARSGQVLYLPASALETGLPLPAGPEGAAALLTIPAPSDPEERGVAPEVLEFFSSGKAEYRQDLVFLAEGYQEHERGRFIEDVEDALEYLAGIEPYSRYLSILNVWGVFFASAESGADHLELDPPTYADTPLGCHYGAFGVDRLIDCDHDAVLAAASWAPGEDVRVVLVNDPTYGGSGGLEFAVIFNGAEMEQGIAHEMGHTDGQLADEYDYGWWSNGEQWPMPNCSWNALEPPWQAWIEAGSPGVGALTPCSYGDYYRPTNDGCMMNILQDQFCVVCREQLLRTIYSHLDSLIQGSSETELELAEDESLRLSLQTIEFTGEDLYFSWEWIEGETELGAGEGLASYDLPWSDLAPGVQTIRVTVEDRIDWVLTDAPAAMTDTWEFSITVAEPATPTKSETSPPAP